ncbi:MAG: M48 family metalloprotease [Azoarcus sp.]|jgi:Zn-dependent protease with chaperone function/Tfp pilus assembly major pilin PilA|nr:M48 family metalloprotease [Azoarcus sp.]
MDQLVYPRERALSALTLFIGLLIWLLLILLTAGIALVYVLMSFIFYVFAQSAFIAWIKGTAVKLSSEQHPDLYKRFEACCKRLDIPEAPEAYIMEGGGMLNAFATRFFGRNFVVLLADVINALEDDPDAINFYFGHELGHIRRGHLTGMPWRLPAMWIPLLGAAYSRAREYTCDLHGRACCASPQQAAQALMVLAAGVRRWKTSNLANYARQSQANSGFWGSFHELIGAYPWLTKRVAYVLEPTGPRTGRNPLAYLLALFVPGGGSGAGFVGVAFMIGILAAIAMPAYHDYQQRAAIGNAWVQTASIREGLSAYYSRTQKVPPSLKSAGQPSTLADGTRIELNAEDMVVSIPLKEGTLLMVPKEVNGGIQWFCASDDLKPTSLPLNCRQ